MKKLYLLLVPCLALGVVIGGCGSDNNNDSSSTSSDNTTTTKQAPANSGSTAKSAVQVIMKNTRFTPMNIKVKAGGTITWTNKDPFAHTVTYGSGPGVKFNSGNVDGGSTFKQKFRTAGQINYVCKIHPNQTGTITVE
jgi:plastocyanin